MRVILAEYRLAVVAGRAWRRLQPRDAERLERVSALTLRLSHGEELSAEETREVQDHTAKMIFGLGWACFMPMFIVVLLSFLYLPPRPAREVITDLTIVPCGYLIALATALMGVVSVRCAATGAYLARASPQQRRKPLPSKNRGRPTPWDFWVPALVVLAFWVTLQILQPGS